MVGAVFALLPRLAPGWFPLTGIDGTSPRMMWLQVMSVLQLGLGLSYFAHRTVVGLASLLEYAPASTFSQAVQSRAPQVAFNPQSAAIPALSPIRAAFKGGIFDQRRAA